MKRLSASRLLLAGCVITALGCGGGSPRSSRAGVYTVEQAAKGKDVYAGMCISCHQGMGNHTGPIFRARWGGYDLNEMYRYIRENMPKNDPGTLPAEDYAAVMAYLLQMNGMPAGKAPLSTDTMSLRRIMYDTSAVPR